MVGRLWSGREFLESTGVVGSGSEGSGSVSSSKGRNSAPKTTQFNIIPDTTTSEFCQLSSSIWYMSKAIQISIVCIAVNYILFILNQFPN